MSTLNPGQIADEAERARADLTGLHYLEIQDDQARARALHTHLSVIADDHGAQQIRTAAKIRLRACTDVLAWMQARSITHYNGPHQSHPD